jgi:hypothetical protein
VHRDIKPSNLLLVGGEVERVKVLDFGIARDNVHTRALTGTGAMLGTVGYMAPEQAMGSKDVDARADVFALGCVLFECLAARPAFAAEHVVAILAKVLTEEAPRVSELVPELNKELDFVVARMLAKKPEDRPADAATVLRMLDERGATMAGAPLTDAKPLRLTHSEQTVVSVILAELPRDAVFDATATPERAAQDVERVRDIALSFGAEFTPLHGGALLFVLGRSGAGDPVTQAAACAIALRRACPNMRFALATGRAQSTGRLPVGAVIDRAAALLRRSNDPGAAGHILVDTLSAGLLDTRFEVEREGEAGRLVAEQHDVEQPRLLLGRRTPYVGRDKDLGILEMTFQECLDEPVARAIVALGPAGIGKSRLRQEFVARVERRAKVLLGRADPVSGRAPLALIRQMLVAELGLGPMQGADPAARHARVRAALAPLVPASEHERLTAFLGEIVGAPPLEGSMTPLFRAAKNDPKIMAEHTRRALEDWVLVLSSGRPLVVVLEDLHWADEGSISCLEGALRRAAERPLFVFALARPEIRERVPPVFPEAQELRLAPLTRKASEALARTMLGDDADPARVARIVEHAGGNAFYLEELIRAAAEHQTGAPESVLAMIEARILRIPPELRRVLRAASVFGERFWDAAVAELVGGTVAGVASLLDTLLEFEFIEVSSSSRFAGTKEYAFRHALVRDAAYAMLTDADRAAAHAQAGEWLEEHGDIDARTVADHFEKGNAPDRALPWIVAAVRAEVGVAQHASASAAALRSLVARGEACGATGSALGFLRVAELFSIEAEGFPPYAAEGISKLTSAAFDGLPPGSDDWWRVARAALTAASNYARPELFMTVLGKVLELSTVSAPTGPFGAAMRWQVMGLINVGQREMAVSMLENLERAGREGGEPDLVFTSELSLAKGYANVAFDNPSAGLADIQRALELAARAGDERLSGVAFLCVPIQLVAGDYVGAVENLNAIRQRGENLAQRYWKTAFEALLECFTGRYADGLARARSIPDSGDSYLATFRRSTMAIAHLRLGNMDAAEFEADQLMDVPWQNMKCVGFTYKAACRLSAGRPDEARALLEQARRNGERVCNPTTRSMLRRLEAESLRAMGDIAGSDAAIRAAAERVRKNAAGMPPDLARRYLEVQENARTLELERAWLES